TYSDGSKSDVTTTATWSAASTAVATVAGAVVKGASVGSTTITALLGSISGSTTLNVTSNTWTATASDMMRSYHTATLLPNGKVFVALGMGFGACCISSAS